MVDVAELLVLCRSYGLDAVYAFGSRGKELAAVLRGEGSLDPANTADFDLGVLPQVGRVGDVEDRVHLTGALEELLNVPRVDLVVLPQAGPYLALDVISGELLCCTDPIREAEYQLFVLRRAGDLAFFERERRRMVLAGIGR